MRRLPTDFEILNTIYERYYEEFASFARDEPGRPTKNFVSIDTKVLGGDMGVDGDIIFTRLYYYLDNRHGYKQDDGRTVHLFTRTLNDDVGQFINFPYAASILASLRDENRKYRLATCMAGVSLLLSVVSLVVSILVRP
jgi:hypothetical protein